MTREIINQSSAARIRGVSRQRISELYSKGRFTIPVDETTGKEVRGAIYLDELESLTDAKRGRPALTPEQRAERGLDAYHVGDSVVWKHTPRDGYGYSININARVDKVGLSRLHLEFENADGVLEAAWVNRSHIVETTYKAGLEKVEPIPTKVNRKCPKLNLVRK